MRVSIPMKAESTANKREHWAAKHRRTKPQRNAAALLVKTRLHELGKARLVVLLERVSPGTLDDDNLRSALKSFRDGVAAALRVDDATPLVRWEYAQRKGKPGEYAVDVSIAWETPAS